MEDGLCVMLNATLSLFYWQCRGRLVASRLKGVAELQAAGLAETWLKHSWQLSPSLGAHKLAPREKPNQALAAQACHKLGSGSGQAKVRFPHLQLRLKQHLLSRDAEF
jgi:hypothetical protein